MRRQYFYDIDEYFINEESKQDASEPKNDSGSDNEQLFKRTRDMEVESKSKLSEHLTVKAVSFVFNNGVNSMIGEIVEGMRELGASLKGQKFRVILTPDFSIRNAKKGSLYHIFRPILISEKLTKSEIPNIILSNEVKLYMIKEEGETQTEKDQKSKTDSKEPQPISSDSDAEMAAEEEKSDKSSQKSSEKDAKSSHKDPKSQTSEKSKPESQKSVKSDKSHSKSEVEKASQNEEGEGEGDEKQSNMSVDGDNAAEEGEGVDQENDEEGEGEADEGEGDEAEGENEEQQEE